MFEGLFILTTIFVAYVVYAIIGEQKATAKSKALAAKPEAQAAAVEQPKPQVAVAKENPAVIKPVAVKTVAPKAAATQAEPPKPAATKTAAAKVAAQPETAKTTTAKPAAAKKATATSAKSAGLKDPKSGDITTAYSNYRFTKRWIKDALVAEGLLEKVYPNNELNAETDAKIKEALGKLEAMDKYKA
jgi:outer membrane biosynthesis protein TonB